jgi:hypothetical protein
MSGMSSHKSGMNEGWAWLLTIRDHKGARDLSAKPAFVVRLQRRKTEFERYFASAAVFPGFRANPTGMYVRKGVNAPLNHLNACTFFLRLALQWPSFKSLKTTLNSTYCLQQ